MRVSFGTLNGFNLISGFKVKSDETGKVYTALTAAEPVLTPEEKDIFTAGFSTRDVCAINRMQTKHAGEDYPHQVTLKSTGLSRREFKSDIFTDKESSIPYSYVKIPKRGLKTLSVEDFSTYRNLYDYLKSAAKNDNLFRAPNSSLILPIAKVMKQIHANESSVSFPKHSPLFELEKIGKLEIKSYISEGREVGYISILG